MIERVVVDMDGVLADFNSGFWQLLTSRGAKLDPIPQEGPETWDYFGLLGATREQVKDAWGAIEANPAWWGTLQPYEWVLELRPLLQELFSEKWCVVMSTRTLAKTAEMVTRLWLRSHIGIPGHVPVVLTENKAAAIVGLGNVTKVIDDHPRLGRNLQQMGCNARIYQPAWPYNQGSIAHHRGSLEEMIREVLK